MGRCLGWGVCVCHARAGRPPPRSLCTRSQMQRRPKRGSEGRAGPTQSRLGAFFCLPPPPLNTLPSMPATLTSAPRAGVTASASRPAARAPGTIGGGPVAGRRGGQAAVAFVASEIHAPPSFSLTRSRLSLSLSLSLSPHPHAAHPARPTATQLAARAPLSAPSPQAGRRARMVRHVREGEEKTTGALFFFSLARPTPPPAALPLSHPPPSRRPLSPPPPTSSPLPPPSPPAGTASPCAS